ncbi:acyl carrier protein phosphodiesterase [Saccharicrinis fermentans]|uniref:Acyl carrier protein phosphodiesterase n=1 Tax=Saccharicrinis fermentans DSM 9555 = JCM 21142 TaxID=869213 RepID=W7Y386_9BACT|nr:acyl carrier protein phosphodiesterase [Saccharicrinis fermentans]GAF02467.1 hypothetical protein JCM21142_31102 [Saccharicrinis fermentans DSM 9555 = JCM 21142]
MVYDHYLAKNWEHYSSVPLSTFVNQVHAYFIRHYFTFPNRVKGFLPFLVKSRRLENYKHIWGVETSLSIMSNHTSLPAKSACATKIMLEQYEALNAEFAAFFEEVQQMVKDHL